MQYTSNAQFQELWAAHHAQQQQKLPASSKGKMTADSSRRSSNACSSVSILPNAQAEAQVHMAAACGDMAASTPGTTAWEGAALRGGGVSSNSGTVVPCLALSNLPGKAPCAASIFSSSGNGLPPPPAALSTPTSAAGAAPNSQPQMLLLNKQQQQQKPKVELAFGRRVESAAGSPRAAGRRSGAGRISGVGVSFGNAVGASPSVSRRGSAADNSCNSPRASSQRDSAQSAFGSAAGKSPLCLPSSTADGSQPRSIPPTPGREAHPSSAHRSKKTGESDTIHLRCDVPTAGAASEGARNNSRKPRTSGSGRSTTITLQCAINAVINTTDGRTSSGDEGAHEAAITPRRLLQSAAAAFSSFVSGHGSSSSSGHASAHQRSSRGPYRSAATPPRGAPNTGAASAARHPSGAPSASANGNVMHTQLVLRRSSNNASRYNSASGAAVPSSNNGGVAPPSSNGTTSWPQAQGSYNGRVPQTSVGGVYESLNSNQGGVGVEWFTPQSSAAGGAAHNNNNNSSSSGYGGTEPAGGDAAAAAARQVRNRAYEQAIQQAAAAVAAAVAAGHPEGPGTPLDTSRAAGNIAADSAAMYSSAHTSFNGLGQKGEMMPAAVLEHLKRQQQQAQHGIDAGAAMARAPSPLAPPAANATPPAAAEASPAAVGQEMTGMAEPIEREILLTLTPAVLPFLAARALTRTPVRLIITPTAVYGDFTDGASLTSAEHKQKKSKKSKVAGFFRRSKAE